jgi:hypothetical protein
MPPEYRRRHSQSSPAPHAAILEFPALAKLGQHTFKPVKIVSRIPVPFGEDSELEQDPRDR